MHWRSTIKLRLILLPLPYVTILLLISWKWISHTFSTTSSFSKVTKPKPGRHTNRLLFHHLTSLLFVFAMYSGLWQRRVVETPPPQISAILLIKTKQNRIFLLSKFLYKEYIFTDILASISHKPLKTSNLWVDITRLSPAFSNTRSWRHQNQPCMACLSISIMEEQLRPPSDRKSVV